MVTSMTPARSPNMNSGWPDEIRSSSDLPCHGSARDEAAMTLKSPSVMASAKCPPMPLWSIVRSSTSRLAAALPALSSGISIMALTSSPADSDSIDLVLRSISSCQLSSDSMRTAATTTRKMTISVGIERLSSGSAASRRR